MQISVIVNLLLASFAVSANQRHGPYNSMQYVNITTSPFESIMNVLLTTPDIVYSTPAVLIVGTKKQLLRCLVDDPEQCEVLYQTGDILSLAISGEHVYLGLLSNVILKCNLNQKDSCKNFKTIGSYVQSLEVAGGYLFAGLETGVVMRCQLIEPYMCELLHELKSQVYSLIHWDEHIYVGLANGKLMRCSLITKNICTLIFTMSGYIMGLSGQGSNLLAVTWDGNFWNCSRKPDATNNCVSTPLNYTNPREVASFNGVVFTLQDSAGIWTCNWANSTACTHYGKIKDARSMAFAYGTYRLQSRYREENATCTWQGNSKCPPFVTYYDAKERSSLEVHVKNGRLYNSLGELVDTSDADEGVEGSAAIFVMEPGGKVLLSNSHKRMLLHTSSLVAGGPVSGAGEIAVKSGVIQKIRACSEHYRPDANLNRQVIQSLRDQGYTEEIDSRSCGEDSESNQSNRMQSNNLDEFNHTETNNQ